MSTRTITRRPRPTIAPPASEHMLRGFYPMKWSEFVGQDRAKVQLITAARAAKLSGRPLPHVLLADGAAGIGKTALALLAAQEMGAHVKLASGRITAAEARLLLAGMANGDVLVIDEVHRLVERSKRDAEWLLNYMQDGVLLGPLGPEEVPRVTIIAATTDSGRLQETLIDRFKLRPPLDRYNVVQATKIAKTMAKRVFAPPLKAPNEKACRRIAEAANCVPRIILSLLETLRDITITQEPTGRIDLVGQVLDWYGLTEDGLDNLAQRYLVVLMEEFHGEPAGAASLRDRLQEPGGLTTVERLLQDKGYIRKISKGRCLTQIGIARARELGAVA